LAPRGTEFTLFHRRKNLVVQNTNFYFSLDTLWGGENNSCYFFLFENEIFDTLKIGIASILKLR